jgi:hypothetical protein
VACRQATKKKKKVEKQKKRPLGLQIDQNLFFHTQQALEELTVSHHSY